VLQPSCIVIGNNAHNLRESDIYSCELPWDPNGMVPEGNTTPAEVCDKISRTWFWNTGDTPEHVKSVQKLAETLSRCNERRANYLLNIPPDRSGQISGEHLKRLRELAAARTAILGEDR